MTEKTVPMAKESPIGNIYTLNEAAAKLRMSRRALQDTIIRLPFYSKNGRVYLFSEDDLKKIWEGMREQSNERLRLLEHSNFGGRLMGTKSPRLRKLLAAPAQKQKARQSSDLQSRIDDMLQKRAARK